jgi:hypothetical protein
MKDKSLNALRVTFTNLLIALEKMGPLPQEPHWEYHRTTSGWAGQLIPKPSFMSLYGMRSLNDLASQLESSLKEEYPEHLQAIGTAFGAGVLQPISILFRLAYDAYTRFGTFAVSQEQRESLIAEVSSFFDRGTVRLRLYAPALNIHGPIDTPAIRFPDGIVLRPITDDECTQFYGGNPIFQARPVQIGFPEFVFVKDIEIPKIVGSFDSVGGNPLEPTQAALERCILALATFKDAGPIGYDGIRVIPNEFTIGAGFGHQSYGSDHIPLGFYAIDPSEVSNIEAHAGQFDAIHPTLEIASQRLVDSTRRTKPRDTLVDAVIGLESILLANLRERTELRFRFSLHYAMLFPIEMRKEAFQRARDLYDIRSTIAHGGTAGNEVKVCGKKMSLGEAATLARSVLRNTIERFMPNSKKPDFMQDDFWPSKELGLL